MDDFAQSGIVYAPDPYTIHLDDGLVGMVEWDDGPICGVQGCCGGTWTCILPPGHECAHLRASDELLEAAGPVRVTQLRGGGRST